MSLDLPILLHHYEALDSTNSFVKVHYQNYDLTRLNLITASTQTHGKGSYGKSWSSPKDLNIYASFFFALEPSSLNLCNLAQLLSLTLARYLTTLGFHPAIKWPNDLLLHDHKVSGILCEVLPIDKRVLVVLGLGLNINMPKSLCEEIDQPTTSLFISSGQILNINKLLNELADAFQKDLVVYLENDFAYFHEEYNMYMVYQNKPVFFQNQYLGLSKQVNPKGLLEIITSQGGIEAISNGSIKLHQF
jgi:BirA family biotin operon repressor/biotin-[acetyl-CoA-carboxylase] ligase